jgi:Protein of unknown function (DUF2778)
MAFSIAWRDGFFAGYDHGSSGGARPQRLFAGAALVCVTFAYAFTAWTNVAGTNLVGVNPVETNPAGTDSERGFSAQPQLLPQPAPTAVSRAYPSRSAIANAYAKLSRALQATASVPSAVNGYVALLDSRYSLGFPPGTFTQSTLDIQETPEASTAPSSGDQVAHTGALPPQQLRSPPRRTATLRDGAGMSRVAAAQPEEKPSIFERLFGKPFAPTLAYAAAEDGMPIGPGALSGRYDRSTAVYDISAHAVYMPDGTTLEAHSGLGGFLDDPNHAQERMRGVTPPAVYDLKLRESPFHGVQALRLIPLDEDKVFGRSGLLAHSFMLGPNGQSNGCVSFRNYEAFLQAYLKHEIKRLVVVARLD